MGQLDASAQVQYFYFVNECTTICWIDILGQERKNWQARYVVGQVSAMGYS